MSELPQIDPVKAAHREISKLREEVEGYRTREAQLEILAEAIRDERDEARAGLEDLRNRLSDSDTEVQDISSLPAK